MTDTRQTDTRQTDTRQAETKRTVLDGAYETFLAFGYSKTTISDIARAAGVSRPTLYRLFEDKSAVFAAVVESIHEEAHERYEAAAHTDAPLATRLAAVGIEKVQTVAGVAGASVHGPELLDANQRMAGEQAAEAHERLRLLLEEVFSSCWVEEFGTRSSDIDPALATAMVMAILEGWVQTVSSDPADTDRDWRSELQLTLELLVAGIREHSTNEPRTTTGAST